MYLRVPSGTLQDVGGGQGGRAGETGEERGQRVGDAVGQQLLQSPHTSSLIHTGSPAQHNYSRTRITRQYLVGTLQHFSS